MAQLYASTYQSVISQYDFHNIHCDPNSLLPSSSQYAHAMIPKQKGSSIQPLTK